MNFHGQINVHPFLFKIILGGAFRIYSDLATSMKWETKACWKINRGENLSPVWSCEGIGDPAYFYLVYTRVECSYAHSVMLIHGFEIVL